MDTQTVLDIIKMLDAKITSLKGLTGDWYKAEESALSSFRDHLQDYIEARVSAMENSTPE